MLNLLAPIVGGILGKGLGNVVEHLLPPPAEKRRNDLKRLKKEKDELLKKEDNPRNRFRINYLMERISVLEDKAVNS